MESKHTLVALPLLFAACSFDPSAGASGAGDPGDGAGGGGGGGVIGGEAEPDGAPQATARVLSASGLATTVGDLGGEGGDEFSADCGPRHLVTGLDAEDNDGGLCRLRASCGEIVVDGDSVEVVSVMQTPQFGNEASYYDIDPVDCPAGSVVVGYFGSESEDNMVHSVHLMCSTVEWDGNTLSLGEPQATDRTLGSPSGGGLGTGACPPDQVAAGIEGRAGTLIDRFQLRCYQPVAMAQ
jgi:hypothetical protein